jgi:hypothetical protein
MPGYAGVNCGGSVHDGLSTMGMVLVIVLPVVVIVAFILNAGIT